MNAPREDHAQRAVDELLAQAGEHNLVEDLGEYDVDQVREAARRAAGALDDELERLAEQLSALSPERLDRLVRAVRARWRSST